MSHSFFRECWTRTRVPTGMSGKEQAWVSCRSLTALLTPRWKEARVRVLSEALEAKVKGWEGTRDRSWRPLSIWAGERPLALGVFRHSSRPEANKTPLMAGTRTSDTPDEGLKPVSIRMNPLQNSG